MDLSRPTLVTQTCEGAQLPPARIYVCDPDPSVLAAIRHLLAGRGHEVHAYEHANALLAAYDPVAHGCVILDAATMSMAGPRLRLGNPHKPIIVSTVDAAMPAAVRQMRNGAFDVLARPMDDATLVAAVAAALEEDRSLAGARAQRAATEDRLTTLTRREHDVLRQLMGGLLNKQIASALGTSLKTVKVHRGRVMQKMNVRTIVELTRLMERTFPHFEFVATHADVTGKRRGGRDAANDSRAKVELDRWRARSLRAGP
jgi:FixJ family two-component response regulator